MEKTLQSVGLLLFLSSMPLAGFASGTYPPY